MNPDPPPSQSQSPPPEVQTQSAPPSQIQPAPTRSAAALDRYTARMRRSRIRYFAVVGVIAVVLGVFAALVWSRGEAAHVTLHTAAHAPTGVAVQTPSIQQQSAWHTTDRLGIGYPVSGGTVITYSKHTVVGRSTRTGATTWSYNRSDRSVCTAAQIGGITMAIYAVAGNCDEISAFDTGTGRREWTRTLDEDGMPLNGRPVYSWTGITLLMNTTSVIYALDPSDGLDRWTYTRNGCHIRRAVLGSSGALISQSCTRPRCANVDHCGRGPQLLLRDATAGKGDDSKPDADQIIWNDIGNSDIPLTAGNVVGALNATTRQVDRYSSTKGNPIGTTTLTPAPKSVDPAAIGRSVETDRADLVQLSGHLYALNSSTRPKWSLPVVARPSLDAGDTGRTPALATARIDVPTANGVELVDGDTGRPRTVAHLPVAIGSGDVIHDAGRGFVVGTPNGVVAYR